MRRIKTYIFAGLLVAVAVFCYGQEETSNLERLFYRGNDYYEKGEHLKAIEEYNKIVSAGYESGPLFYNLGNAYFRIGELGEALLNYERAGRLIPRDADLKANSGFARAKIMGSVLEKKGLWTWRPLRLYTDNFTVNELTWMSSAVCVFIVLLLVIAVSRLDLKNHMAILVLLFFLFGMGNLVINWYKAESIGKEAIVVTPEIDSRYGPFDSATVFFKLHEGMKVRVLREKDDWDKVKRDDGKMGWVKREAIEII
ncbi:MAG: SH3 domain-containing protein [Candidatus Omnitrophota bacterium]